VGGWGHHVDKGVLVAVVESAATASALPFAWMAKGACRGLTNVFFPPSAERPQARDRREALARTVCAGCSVLGTCREFARVNHEYGFWGGESEDERHAAGYRLIAPIGTRARPFEVVAG
jgi:WhiB family transcriptional regulator, redox-sensing transcriptional regulator